MPLEGLQRLVVGLDGECPAKETVMETFHTEHDYQCLFIEFGIVSFDWCQGAGCK